ncbi:hypothetical protein NQZ68_038781 [Dissostichus eleginoides]|nr:hypothetical protein NQZ68_038781 [Dissostichus eleginoides]
MEGRTFRFAHGADVSASAGPATVARVHENARICHGTYREVDCDRMEPIQPLGSCAHSGSDFKKTPLHTAALLVSYACLLSHLQSSQRHFESPSLLLTSPHHLLLTFISLLFSFTPFTSLALFFLSLRP